MWDLNSPTRDQTHTPSSGSAVLTTAPPGTSQQHSYFKIDIIGHKWYVPGILE